jgi:hypothetical protein
MVLVEVPRGQTLSNHDHVDSTRSVMPQPSQFHRQYNMLQVWKRLFWSVWICLGTLFIIGSPMIPHWVPCLSILSAASRTRRRACPLGQRRICMYDHVGALSCIHIIYYIFSIYFYMGSDLNSLICKPPFFADQKFTWSTSRFCHLFAFSWSHPWSLIPPHEHYLWEKTNVTESWPIIYSIIFITSSLTSFETASGMAGGNACEEAYSIINNIYWYYIVYIQRNAKDHSSHLWPSANYRITPSHGKGKPLRP